MENKTGYVTHIELELHTSKLRSDLKREIRLVDENLNAKISGVDDKVDGLKEIVLPMAESSKQTADNTKKTAELMERFTDEQRRTNGKFHDKFHNHDLKFSGIENEFAAVGVKLDARSEAKKHNVTLWTAIIGILGLVVSGIFQIAPLLFN